MIISLIAALGHKRVIGCDNQLPWQMPDDLAFFKATTLSKPIIMGRSSFDAIGRPLPSRRNIVLTRNVDFVAKGCEVVHSLEDAIALVKDEPEVMIIGGGKVYEQSLKLAHRMYLTFIDADVKGDAFFPEWDSDEWEIVSREEHSADDKHAYDYSFVQLERVITPQT